MQTPSTTLYVRESRLTVFETAMVRDRLPDEPEVAPFRPSTEAAPAPLYWQLAVRLGNLLTPSRGNPTSSRRWIHESSPLCGGH